MKKSRTILVTFMACMFCYFSHPVHAIIGKTGGNNDIAKYSPELIWWFVALMIFGVLLTIWWLIPTKAEKSRKKYKNSGKSIDKTKNLR